MKRGSLSGSRVIVAGAGLAGLTAARDLERDGASVILLEARDRLGGRVLTVRDGFHGRQHAEAGADLIEGAQTSVLDLASELGLKTARILRRGWGFYGEDDRGRRRVRRQPTAFEQAAAALAREIHDFKLTNERWDSAVAAVHARTSVAEWLERIEATRAFSAAMRGLRGFFLADPEDLSLLVLIEQFASGDAPGNDRMLRVRGGNDRLVEALADSIEGEIVTGAIVRRVARTRERVTVTVEIRGSQLQVPGDYCVVAIPAAVLREVVFEPALPEEQARAVGALQYGPATRLLLQFERPFWRRARRPHAFGTDLPLGAVWDGSEEQRGRPAVLSLLAGGRASAELQALAADGPGTVLQHLRWLGKPSRLLAARTVVWENDPWARGGYAVFDPGFDPTLRSWLPRPAGRVLFAGEHTSVRWQGYMSGAIESGHRAAAEVRALALDG